METTTIDTSRRSDVGGARAGCEILGVAPSSLYAILPKLPPGIAWRIGKSWRISRSRLIAWRDAGGTAPAHAPSSEARS